MSRDTLLGTMVNVLQSERDVLAKELTAAKSAASEEQTIHLGVNGFHGKHRRVETHMAFEKSSRTIKMLSDRTRHLMEMCPLHHHLWPTW